MKTGRTLQELALELHRQLGAKRDFVIGTQSMDIREAADRFRLLPDNEPELSFHMSDLFHRQMGALLGIPAKNYDKINEV